MDNQKKDPECQWQGIPRSKIDWFPTIDRDKCIDCLTCVKFCKSNVYQAIENKPQVVNPQNCVVGCRGCESKCPVGAISHPTDEYLAELKNNQSNPETPECPSTCKI